MLKESAEAKKEEKRNNIYLEEANKLIDYEDFVKVAVLGTDGIYATAKKKENQYTKGECSLAKRRMCMKQDEMDRRGLLRKEAEKAMKQDGIECLHNIVKKHKEEDETHKHVVEGVQGTTC